MSERYIRLFTGEANLYTEDAPVVIRANALLKDTETGRVIAQLKLQNFSEKIISYAKVAITQFDSVKNPIGDAVLYEYLDLSVASGEEFGSKMPIPMPNSSTRSLAVEVTDICFLDGTVWSNSNTCWQPVVDDSKIMTLIATEQSYKEALALSRASDQESVEKAKDIFDKISSIKDVSYEIEMCNKKLEAINFAKVQESQNKNKKKKRIKAIAIPLVSLFAVLLIFFLVCSYIVPSAVKYKGELLEKEGKYWEAFAWYAKYYESVWEDIGIDKTIYFDDEAAEALIKELNSYIEAGDTENIIDFVLFYIYSDFTYYNYYYSFGDIIDNNRVFLGNGKEKEAEGVYNALIYMIDSERFQEIIGSVSGYEESIYVDRERYLILMKHLIASLPGGYRDIESIEEFLNAYDAYDIEELIKYHSDIISDVWKYKWCREELINNYAEDMLLGYWVSSDGQQYLKFYTSGGSNYFNTSLEIPDVDEAHYYAFEKELVYFYSASDSIKRWNVFKFTFSEKSINELNVYCYENGATVTLTRE